MSNATRTPDSKSPGPLRRLLDGLGASEQRPRMGQLYGAAGGVSLGSTAVKKLKVNFVPVNELKSIIGIGDKISTRMHLLRLTEGNLTAERLRNEFGGKMTDAMLQQMDFEKSDMLIDRGFDVKASSLMPQSLEATFEAAKGYKEIEVKLNKKGNKKERKIKEEPEEDIMHTKSTKKDKKKHSKRYRHPSVSQDDSEDESEKEKKSKRQSKKPKKKNEHKEYDTSDEEPKIKSKRHVKKVYTTSETSGTSESNEDTDFSSDDDAENIQTPSLQKMPKGFDKTLRFSASNDGKGDDFDSFKFKFKSYAKAFNWTEEECRYCLCWSLQGPAAKYHTLISSGKGPLTYKQLMKKLEKRFGGEELIETAQARFNQACQEPKESLEVWADRVQVLALRAFKNLPESYAASQAVSRFCLGLEDKEASRDASLKRFKTIDEAKDYVHYFLHISSASAKPKTSRRSSSRDQDEMVNVYETSISQDDFRKEIQQLRQYFDEKLSMIGTAKETNNNVRGYGRGRGYQQRDNGRNQAGYGRGRGEWGRPKRGRDGRGSGSSNRPTQETGWRNNNTGVGLNDCFHCGETGHIRADCKKWLAMQECFNCHQFGHRRNTCPNMQPVKEDNQGNLNGRGSGEGAKPDS